jgi:hypothetical protein
MKAVVLMITRQRGTLAARKPTRARACTVNIRAGHQAPLAHGQHKLWQDDDGTSGLRQEPSSPADREGWDPVPRARGQL